MSKIKEYENSLRKKGLPESVIKVKVNTFIKNQQVLNKKTYAQKTRERNYSKRTSFVVTRIRNGIDHTTNEFLENISNSQAKMFLKNNMKELEVAGASRTRIKNAINKINNFDLSKNSKQKMISDIMKSYGDIFDAKSGDLFKKGSKRANIFKESFALTKQGNIRKRFKKPNFNKREIDIRNQTKLNNLERTAFRVLKVEGVIKGFDSDGYGIVSSYFFDSLKWFASIPDSGLDDLENFMFESVTENGYVNGKMTYLVKVNPHVKDMIDEYMSTPHSANDKYARAISYISKRKTILDNEDLWDDED